ncbi:ribosome biogenesis protein [Candidatus Micrarchaeota archaeon]|nr:ribosome biogenesis protein [Candidatus Micrarchaeota archaeon]
MKKIFRCLVCGVYTLNSLHCGSKTKSVHPPPFNPNDAYAYYRRKMKGLL